MVCLRARSDEEYGLFVDVIGSVGDAAAAGIGPQQSPDQPAAWTLYFASDDADATARAVSSAGGHIPPRSGGRRVA